MACSAPKNINSLHREMMSSHKQSLVIEGVVVVALSALASVAIALNISPTLFSSIAIPLSAVPFIGIAMYRQALSEFSEAAKSGQPLTPWMAQGLEQAPKFLRTIAIVAAVVLVLFSTLSTLALGNVISTSTAGWIGLSPAFFITGFFIYLACEHAISRRNQ